MGRPSWAPAGIDIDRPSTARVYDSFLGGSHNFACDREVMQRTIQLVPELPLIARAFRAFVGRAVRFCVDSGIDQFLDLGSGIPTVGNVHEIAQQVRPTSRVVYVDIDPVAVAHSEAILAGNPYAACIQADLRQPKQILGDATLREMLDFTRPIAVLMLAVLHFLPDRQHPDEVIAHFHDAVVPGSLLAISHPSNDGPRGDRMQASVSEFTSAVGDSVQLRSHAQIAALFAGFELVEPGLVPLGAWRPDHATTDTTPPTPQFGYCGIGRKP